MNDLDQDLREMFRRHEADVRGPAALPPGIRRRVRRRQTATVLAAILMIGALVVGGLSLRMVVGDRPRPAHSPTPTLPLQSMILRGFGVGFSADGTRLLTRSMTDPRGFIYDPRTGKLVQTVRGPRNPGAPRKTGLIQAFAPNGELFASVSWGGNLITWVNDAATGKPLWRLPGACCLGAFSPAGRFFAAPCCGIGTRVYDLDTGRSVNRFSAWGVMAFSPDGERLAISVGKDEPGNVVAYVWNTLTGGPGNPVLTLHERGGANVAVASVAWSPDGSMIAVVTGRGAQRTAMVFSARTGERIFTIDPPSSALSVAFAPDSSMIAIGSTDGGASVWRVSPNPTTPILTFHAHETEVAAIAFSPDGTQLMTGAWNQNETKVWDMTSLSPSAETP